MYLQKYKGITNHVNMNRTHMLSTYDSKYVTNVLGVKMLHQIKVQLFKL